MSEPKNTRNTFRSFVRGGQTTIHTLRMLNQVFRVVAGIYFLIIAIVVGTWLVTGTEGYDRYLSYKFYEAEMFVLAGASPDKEMWIDFPDGTQAKSTILAILSDPVIQAAKDGLVETVYRAFIWGSIVGGIVTTVVLWFFIGHGFSVVKERQMRGASAVSHRALKRRVRIHNARQMRGRRLRSCLSKERNPAHRPYHIVDIPYPYRAETLHTMVAGTTGTGKTTIIRKLLEEIRARGDRAVVFDKMGNFVEEFFEPGRDILLNPLDQRCPHWSLFEDAERANDFDTIAEAMIPRPKRGEPVWTDSARAIFSVGAQLLQRDGKGTTDALVEMLLKTDLGELGTFFEGTIGAPIINKDSSRMSNSVRLMLNTYLRPLTLLPLDGPRFSIRDWMCAEGDSGTLFLTSRADMHSTLRPLISVWMDLAIKSLLSQPRDQQRIVWFIIDEVASLHKLPSLEEGLKEGRQFGACYVLGVQVQSQLRDIYGIDGAQSISGLCRNKVVLAASDRETAEWYAGAFGKREVRRLDEGFSYGASVIRDGVNFSAREKSELLILPEDILNLPNLTGFVKLAEGFPAARFRLPYHAFKPRAKTFIERPGSQALARRVKRERTPDKNSKGGGGRTQSSDTGISAGIRAGKPVGDKARKGKGQSAGEEVGEEAGAENAGELSKYLTEV